MCVLCACISEGIHVPLCKVRSHGQTSWVVLSFYLTTVVFSSLCHCIAYSRLASPVLPASSPEFASHLPVEVPGLQLSITTLTFAVSVHVFSCLNSGHQTHMKSTFIHHAISPACATCFKFNMQQLTWTRVLVLCISIIFPLMKFLKLYKYYGPAAVWVLVLRWRRGVGTKKWTIWPPNEFHTSGQPK